jgi:hypothetical protein
LKPDKILEAYGIIFPFADANEQQEILGNIIGMLRPNIKILEPGQLANFLRLLSEVIKNVMSYAKDDAIRDVLEQLQPQNIRFMLLDELKTNLLGNKIEKEETDDKNKEINAQIDALLDNLSAFQKEIDKMVKFDEQKKAIANEVMAVITKVILSILNKSESAAIDVKKLISLLQLTNIGIISASTSFDTCEDAALMGLAKLKFITKLMNLDDNPPLKEIINIVADECSRNLITEVLQKISEVLVNLGVSDKEYAKTEILEGELFLYLVHDVLNAKFVESELPVDMMNFVEIAIKALEGMQTRIKEKLEMFLEKLKLNCTIDELRKKFAPQLTKIKDVFGELTGQYEVQYDFTRIETVILLILEYRSEDVMAANVGGEQFADVIGPEIAKSRPTISDANLIDAMGAAKRLGSALGPLKEVTNDDGLKEDMDNTIPAINDLNENSSYQDLFKAMQEIYDLLVGANVIGYECLPNPDFNLAACGISPDDLSVIASFVLLTIQALSQKAVAGCLAQPIHNYFQEVVI